MNGYLPSSLLVDLSRSVRRGRGVGHAARAVHRSGRGKWHGEERVRTAEVQLPVGRELRKRFVIVRNVIDVVLVDAEGESDGVG